MGGTRTGGGRMRGCRRRKEVGGRSNISGFVNEKMTISSIFDEWMVGFSITGINHFEFLFEVNDNAV